MSEQQQEYGGIIINGIDCSGGGGSSVTPNPPAPATETLSSLDINGVVYGIEQETRENIFSIFDTFIKNSKYSTNSTFTPNVSFNFNSNDYIDNWSTNATIFNNNAFDLTDCDKLEIVIDITEQADYGYFWVTLSQTKYTWGTSEWPGLYDNIDSVLQISQSGSYTIDVSELTGNYYIYLGTTTGKTSTTHGGGCDNTKNGKIIGTVSEFYTVSKESGGTEVIANPTETPTDTLNTISIDGTVYEIEGGGSGGGSAYTETVLWENSSGLSFKPNDSKTVTLSDSLSNYDAISFVFGGSSNSNSKATFLVLTSDLVNYSTEGVLSICMRGSVNYNPITYYVDNTHITFGGWTNSETAYAYKVVGVKYGGSGGGGAILEYADYAQFVKGDHIILPFTLDGDYTIEVDFQYTGTYESDQHCIGTTNGTGGKIHVTQYGGGNDWYYSVGTTEHHFSNSALTDRHTFVFNDSNHKVLFDNVVKDDYTPTTDANVILTIGSRDGTKNYKGRIFNYKITSLSQDKVLFNLMPVRVKIGNIVIKEGLYDTVSGEIYTCNGMTVEGNEGSIVVGADIEPNPEDTPTETLSTIRIDDTVYNIAGGSGGEGTQIDVLFNKTPDNIHEPTITLSNSLFDYDEIAIDYVYVGNNIPYHIGHSYMTDDLNIGDNIGFESGSGNTWYSITNNTTLTLAQSQTAWCVVSIIGFKYGSGGSGGGSSTFIDTSNKLQTIQVASGDDWSYVATQDCWATINPWNSSNSTPSQIYLDNVELVAVYNSRPQYAIYIKQGQTLLIKARTDYTYGSIYGLLQGGGGTGGGNVDDVYVNGQSVLDSNKIAQVKTHVEKTTAAYYDIPEEIRNTDNVLYAITDDGIHLGDTFNPVIYSTEEREIGVWTDNKPLYQKTVIKSGTISQRETISLGIANVENIFLVSDASNVNNGTTPLPLVTGTDNNNNTGGFFDIQQSDTSFLFRIGSGMVGYVKNAIITVQYTKTTDVAGSGGYNTLGVPTVHYDANEKIIGTWFGQTLYEKSYEINNPSSTDITVDDMSAYIDEAINFDGSFHRVISSNDKRWYPFSGRTESSSYNSYKVNSTVESGVLKIGIYGYSPSEIDKLLVTIQYTKITD